MLYKIGEDHQVRDYNVEKNKFLETVYDKLNDRNTTGIKETTADYCSRFLNYNPKEIEDITSK